MLKLCLKLLLLCFGVFLALDALLPTLTQTLTIKGHSFSSSSKGRGDRYYIEFGNYRLDSCTVSQKQYSALQNGDELVVSSSRLLKNCIKIERDGVVIKHKSFWRLLGLALGACFIAYGVGWFKPEKWWPQRNA